ncbi:hypothetical protein C1Y63_04730 [Corynebacterium sp. 13CS0277]|uniref:hypothetical protein n=1 Tax=Corynebacterium sp. 13CS0277 TaxID=2071994 RepID=UPI000D047C92|nr:hypothetical protein [Corynebacterium sp. 13CS0277]PRQ11717.1 hypothetical protein C1Y63_04730 [Corynebacterium sp. 13CS0277]
MTGTTTAVGCASHDGLDYQLATYLHSVGLCRHPDDDQQAPGDTPAVFLGFLPDQPDAAIAVRVLMEDRDGDDANPTYLVSLTGRAAPWDMEALRRIMGGAFAALHDRQGFPLTAAQRVLLSRRTQMGALHHDQNRRWQRADVYRLLLLAPD